MLKTKLRRRLLSYMFTHHDERFYVRELANLIDVDPGNLSRELVKLENEGLFRSLFKGKIKLFSINKEYPVYKELKKIILKTEGVEGSLISLLGQYKDISLSFVYGSYANNKENMIFDVDMIVIGKIPIHDFTRQIRRLESQLDKEINFTHYSDEEFDSEKEKQGGFLSLIL